MLKYKGQAVSFIQFVTAKPIKHGLKVFVAAYASTAIMIAFKIYVGSELIVRDDSVVAVCDRLISAVGLTNARDLVLYTLKNYTSVALAKHMWVNPK